jgi:hypothetical protein
MQTTAHARVIGSASSVSSVADVDKVLAQRRSCYVGGWNRVAACEGAYGDAGTAQ